MKFTLDNIISSLLTVMKQDAIPGSEKILLNSLTFLGCLISHNKTFFHYSMVLKNFVVVFMPYSQDNTRIKLIRKLQRNKEKKRLFDVSFELFWAPLVLVMCSMLYYLNIYCLFYRSVS